MTKAAKTQVPAHRALGFTDAQIAEIGREKFPLTQLVQEPVIQREEMLRPYEPPRGVLPEGVGPQFAHDEAGFNPVFGNLANYGSAFLAGPGIGFIGYPFLAELSQRPEYRRAAEIIAKEMTRKWIRLKSTGTDKSDAKNKRIQKMNAAMKRHRLRAIFRQGSMFDGLFGRGQIYIDTGYTDDPAALKSPLIVDKRTIKKGSLRGFRTVEPVWTSPSVYNANDALNEHFYRPQTWYVNAKEIHRTRLLTLVGRPVPDILKPAYNFGGMSLLQLGIPYVNNWVRTRQSVSDITHAFSVPVLKTQLGDILNLGAMKQFINRALAFNRFRDNRGLFIVDKDKEDFMIAAAPLGSLDKLQAQAQEHLSAVWGIPLVVYLGITPSGLNASSDGEIRTFYAWVHAQQEDLFEDPIKTCLDVIQLDEFGDIDPEITFEFVSLWELDEAAKAAVQKTKADTHAIYMADGVVSNEEVREQLANDEDSPYAALDLAGTPAPEMETGEEEIEEKPRIGGNPAKSEAGQSGVGES